MTALSRRRLLAGLAGTTGSAMTLPVLAQQSAEAIVPMTPPRPRFEGIPEIQAERREREFWQPGYWKWNGRTYDWIEGRYVVRPFAGAVWVPGHWERRNGGWVFVDGRWS
jgi:hypothetical protein